MKKYSVFFFSVFFCCMFKEMDAMKDAQKTATYYTIHQETLRNSESDQDPLAPCRVETPRYGTEGEHEVRIDMSEHQNELERIVVKRQKIHCCETFVAGSTGCILGYFLGIGFAFAVEGLYLALR